MSSAPERSNRHWAADGDSPLNWLILFVVVIALPLFLAWGQVRQMARDSHRDEVGRIRGELQAQAIVLSEQFTREAILASPFIWAMGADPAYPTATMRKWSRRCPEAFRWYLWTGDLNPVAVPMADALPMQAVWNDLVRQVLSLPWERRRTLINSGLPKSLPSYGRLQRYLGVEVTADDFLLNPNRFHSLRLGGRHARIAWFHTIDEIPAEKTAGVILLVYPDLLPQGFLEEAFMQGNRQLKMRGDQPLWLTYLDLEDRRRTRIQKGLLRTRRQVAALQRAYLSRADAVFQVGSRLFTPVVAKTGATPGGILLLACSLKEQDRTLAMHLERIDRISAWALILALACWGAGWFSLAWGVSLRIRLAMLFSIAILLPMSQLVLTWMQFRVFQTRDELNRLQERLQQTETSLQSRFEAFPFDFSRVLTGRLDRIQEQAPERWPDLLGGIFRSGLADNVYVADSRARITHLFGIKPDKGVELLLKAQLQEAMRETEVLDRQENPLGAAMNEEMNAVVGKEGGSMIIGSFANRVLKKYVLGRTIHYFMYFILRSRDVTRAGLIRLSPQRLGWWFSLYERRRAARRKPSQIADNEPLVWFCPNRQFAPWPPTSQVWGDPLVVRSLGGGQRTTGEIVVEGERCLLFMPGVEFPYAYRPLLLQPLAAHFVERRNEDWRFAERLGLGFLIVLVMGSALATRLLSPIGRVDEALRAIGQGTLDTRIPVNGSDEIARMSQAFNEMAQGLQERERMTRFLSRSAVQAVKSASDAGRGGSRTFAVILFSDIRSFTTISERCSAEEVVTLLNAYFDRMAAVVQRHHGDIDKYIGDAIMAVFRPADDLAGGVHGKTDQAGLVLDAVRCALEMRTTLAAMNAERRGTGLFEIENGIGIGAGEVIAGNIGSQGRLDHTVIGDVVNTASRLEGMSKLGRHSRIIISRAVFDLLGPRLVAEPLAERTVKGKSEAVEMFEVIDLREIPGAG